MYQLNKSQMKGKNILKNKELNKVKKNGSFLKSVRESFRMFPVILLGMLDTIIVLIPTYLENYLPNLYQYIHLSQPQYTEALAYYGIFMMIMSFVGAYLGGKFKGRTLVLWALIIQIVVIVWYGSLMFQTNTDWIYYQWIGILFVISFAISGLIWGPMWRIIKNYGTEELETKDKEKKVARNNGVAGTYEALLGVILAGVGALLVSMEQEWHLWDPIKMSNGKEISIAFLCLIGLTLFLTVIGTMFAFKLIKPAEDAAAKTFTIKSVWRVVKNWKVWMLAFVVIGVFMLQMELSAYINYLKNSLLIAAGIVTVFGIIRTYVMRFLLAGIVGAKADRMHSYIFLLVCGLFAGIILIIVAACLPGFHGSEIKTINDIGYSSAIVLTLQILAVVNLCVLGGLTWVLVTLRWSPIGTELGVTNDSYSSVIALLSAVGFSPGIYFKFIKKSIESHNQVPSIDGGDLMVTSLYGNQMILLTCAGLATIGLIGGLTLYINLYRQKPVYRFRWLQIKKPIFDKVEINQADVNKVEVNKVEVNETE